MILRLMFLNWYIRVGKSARGNLKVELGGNSITSLHGYRTRCLLIGGFYDPSADIERVRMEGWEVGMFETCGAWVKVVARCREGTVEECLRLRQID